MKVYPMVSATYITYEYSTTPDSDTFWSLVTFFHAQIPALAERGIFGYYTVSPIDTGTKLASSKGILKGRWIATDMSDEEATTSLRPMNEHIGSACWADNVTITSNITESTPFMNLWLRVKQADTAGYNVRMGSRLLTNTSLLGSPTRLAKGLRIATSYSQNLTYPLILLGSIVGAAPSTRWPKNRIAGGSNAVLPAWRKTYSHLMLPRTWASDSKTEKAATTTDLREVRVPALRELEPDSGAYMSESDPTELD